MPSIRPPRWGVAERRHRSPVLITTALRDCQSPAPPAGIPEQILHRRLMVVSSTVPLLILGASARGAAQSACRAGFRPLCVDAYADRDLRELTPVHSWPDSPGQLVPWLKTLPQVPWIYTGGGENRPGLVGCLARRQPLLGCGARVLRRARDPFAVAELLARFRIQTLPVCPPRAPPPADGQWLVKPRRGSGGRGVVFWGPPHKPLPREPYYFQRWVGGEDFSGLFLAHADRTELLGTTRQWSGRVAGTALLHAWHGNLVGETPSPSVLQHLHSLGAVLAEQLELRGLFGCDFRLEGETPWLLEINPRYTASVELFEWILRRPLLREHASACGYPGELPPLPSDIDREMHCSSAQRPRFVAKRIVYANEPGVAEFPPDLPRWRLGFTPAVYSDIPVAGQPLRPGDPVCTVLAGGASPEDCLQTLDLREAEVRRWIRTP